MGSLILVGALEHGFLMGYIGVFNGIEWDIIINMEPCNFMTVHILGISSSQLTNSYFSEG